MSRTSLPPARAALRAFAEGADDYLAACLPSAAQDLDDRAVLDALYRRFGKGLAEALAPGSRTPSPVAGHPDGNWLKSSHSVGVNLRTTRGVWGAVKFVLTLPPAVTSVHLLPVFEPGVVGSLYGMASWRVNAEFFDPTWARIVPGLRTVEDQLLAFVNLCHLLGKAVGLDVIPHVDRFSEIALANPWLFEWVRRTDDVLLDHSADLHFEVEETIATFARGASDGDGDRRARAFFARPEAEIAAELFGAGDAAQRNARRDALIQYLYERGYETLPATMAPPYRGLEPDPDPAAVTVDARGRRWRDYRFTAPEPMSRAFGPLTRYKLYERLDDNRDWGVDFDRPRPYAFAYVAERYAAAVGHFGFDFMRGDMSHVQMRPSGVPADAAADPYYDIHAYVKRACRAVCSHFAYFAESFLTADDFMTYGSEFDHLEASGAEVALGNLQNYAPSDPDHATVFNAYLAAAARRTCAPCFTYFTADKDDPRFDRFYLGGNVARYALALLCPALPAYGSLGFRQREPRYTPADNEAYTKLYVFHYDDGPKATHGPYRWGTNEQLCERLRQIESIADDLDAREAAALTNRTRPALVGDHHFAYAWALDRMTVVVNFDTAAASLSLGAVAAAAAQPLGTTPLLHYAGSDPLYPTGTLDDECLELPPGYAVLSLDPPSA